MLLSDIASSHSVPLASPDNSECDTALWALASTQQTLEYLLALEYLFWVDFYIRRKIVVDRSKRFLSMKVHYQHFKIIFSGNHTVLGIFS